MNHQWNVLQLLQELSLLSVKFYLCLFDVGKFSIQKNLLGDNILSKTLKVEYSGAMDITEIKSKVTDEVKNKITNMNSAHFS